MTGAPLPPATIQYRTYPSPNPVDDFGIAEGLGRNFSYRADAVRSMLAAMAQIAEAEITVALEGNRIVGFVILSGPHPQSRWGRTSLKGLYEVTAFEVARPWQKRGIGTKLLRTALHSEWDERIVLASLDPEEWDIVGMGVSKKVYRQMLLSVFRKADFAEYPWHLDVGLSHDPSSLFMVRMGPRVARDQLRQFESVLGTESPRSLHEINRLPREERESLYRRLIPERIFSTFDIDAVSLTDKSGNRLVEFLCPPDRGMVRIGVRGGPLDPDWYYLLKLQTTAYNEVELAFVVINDPRSERFDIDRDPEGRDTNLGTTGRNIEEEMRAIRSGLAPGQTRRGLRSLREAVRLVEEFVAWMGHDLFTLEAMFYHNAILYERYGFGYTVGREEMEKVHREFQPGGELQARMNGSTAFREPGAERTVRGRSWAIHDGILGKLWQAPRMYKHVGKDQGVSTFPEGTWEIDARNDR